MTKARGPVQTGSTPEMRCKQSRFAGRWGTIWLFSALLLAACGTTATFILQQYAGAVRPPEQVAILRINGGQGPELASLDGKVMGIALTDKTARIHIEMLPGTHNLSVANPAEFGRPSEVWFKAEAQHVYRATLVNVPVLRSNGESRTTVRGAVYEVDRETDALLRDVSVLPKTRFPKALEPSPEPETEPEVVEQPAPTAEPTEAAAGAPSEALAGTGGEPAGVVTPSVAGAGGAAPF